MFQFTDENLGTWRPDYIFIEKKFTYKWTPAVQIDVVQWSIVLFSGCGNARNTFRM